MLYFSLFILFALFGLLDLERLKIKEKQLLFIGGILVLMLFGSIRWQTGTDWNNYYNYFVDNKALDEFNTGKFETGYALLNYFIKTISHSYTTFLFVFIVMVIGIKASYLFSYHEFLLISLLCFYSFYIGDMFATRQALAISFTFLSTQYIIRKEFYKFLICVLLAMSFHITAFVFLPAYWIFHRHYSNRTTIVFLLASIAFGITNLPNLILSQAEAFGNNMATYKVFFYLQNEVTNENVSKGIFLLFGYGRRILLLPVLLYYRQTLAAKEKNFDGLLNLFVFGNALYFIFSQALPVFGRASGYFVIYEIILLCSCLYLAKDKATLYFIYILIVLYCLFRLTYALFTYWDLFYPYYSIFSNAIQRELY